MRWKGRKRSANVNDDRGRAGSGGGIGFPGGSRRSPLPMGGGRRQGGFGIGTLIIIGIDMASCGV